MLRIISLVFFTLGGIANLAFAQEAQTTNSQSALTTEQSPQTIEVSSNKDPELKSYRTMLKGLDAYEGNKKLAPQAPIRFMLTSRDPALSPAKLSLRIVGDTFSLPIELANDGSFALPRSSQALDEKADLVLNVKKNLIGWRPMIRTPDLPRNQMRLGDLRLECEVRWAIEYDDTPFFIRNLFRLAGGPCHSRKISYDVFAPKVLAAKLIQGERVLKLTAYKDRIYPPLSDETWSDDALIELTFSEN